jgi:hypothetical protein
MTLAHCLSRSASWRRTGTAEFPYTALVAGQTWLVRLNDFPVDPMYSLLIDGREVGDFDDWPACWSRPN